MKIISKIYNKIRVYKEDRLLETTIKKILEHSTEHSTFIDVGCYKGEWIETIIGVSKDTIIHAFEPTKKNYEYLVGKFNDNKSIKINQMAVSDKFGELSFYQYEDDSCNSLNFKLDDVNPLITLNVTKVQSTSLDKYCKENQIKRIDLLKVDSEGNELKVFNGASNLLKSSSIKCIITEVMFVPRYEGGVLFSELNHYLALNEFLLFGFFGLKYSKDGSLKWGNAIYILKK